MDYDFHHGARVARRAAALIFTDDGNRRAGQRTPGEKMSGQGSKRPGGAMKAPYRIMRLLVPAPHLDYLRYLLPPSRECV